MHIKTLSEKIWTIAAYSVVIALISGEIISRYYPELLQKVVIDINVDQQPYLAFVFLCALVLAFCSIVRVGTDILTLGWVLILLAWDKWAPARLKPKPKPVIPLAVEMVYNEVGSTLELPAGSYSIRFYADTVLCIIDLATRAEFSHSFTTKMMKEQTHHPDNSITLKFWVKEV